MEQELNAVELKEPMGKTLSAVLLSYALLIPSFYLGNLISSFFKGYVLPFLGIEYEDKTMLGWLWGGVPFVGAYLGEYIGYYKDAVVWILKEMIPAVTQGSIAIDFPIVFVFILFRPKNKSAVLLSLFACATLILLGSLILLVMKESPITDHIIIISEYIGFMIVGVVLWWGRNSFG